MNAEIFLIVLPVFLVIGLGFSLKKTGLVKADFLYNLNRLIYYIALPALLFYKISKADFLVSFNGLLLCGMIVSIVTIFVFSYGYGTIRGYRPSVHGAFCQGAFRGNLAYIGLAIVDSAYGEAGFAIAGILLGFLVPLLNFLSVVALVFPNRRHSSGQKALSLVKQIMYNPLILSSFSGIIWSFLALPLPQIVDRALGIITGMSLPLALISIGASFSFNKLRGDLAVATLSTCIKIVILPALTGGILYLFGVHGQELAIGVLLAGTPTATAAYIMAQQLKGDAELSGAIIMLSTLSSIFTYTFYLYWLQLIGI